MPLFSFLVRGLMLGLVIFLGTAPLRADPSTNVSPAAEKAAQAPTARIVPKVHSASGADYPMLNNETPDGPTDADIGPVQRHFTMARDVDTPDVAANPVIKQQNNPIVLDKNISVPSIHEVNNDGQTSTGSNQALQFELDYLNWGAVTGSQLNARRGDYFTITWNNDGPKQDFVTCFEYRQVKTKEVIRKLVSLASAASGGKRAYFAVVGRSFQTYGPISSWRFTVLKGDTVVAEAKSYIW